MEMNEKLKNIFYKSAAAATLVGAMVIGFDKYYDIIVKPKSELPEEIIKYIITAENNERTEDAIHEENHMELHRRCNQTNSELVKKIYEAKDETIAVTKDNLEQITDYYESGAAAEKLKIIDYKISNVEQKIKEISICHQEELERKTAENNARLETEKRVPESRSSAERELERVNYQRNLEEIQRSNREKQQAPTSHSISQPIVTATLEPLRPSPYQSELARYIQCAAQMIGENAGSDYQTINGYLENRFHLNLNNFQNAESLFNKLRNNVNNDNAGLLFAFQICTGYEHGEYNKAYYENQLRIWQSGRRNSFIPKEFPSSSRLVGYSNRTEADVEREKEFFRQRNNQSTQYVPQNTPQQSINTNNTTLQRSPTRGSQQMSQQAPSSSPSILRGSYNDPETRARIEADLDQYRQEMLRKREQYKREDEEKRLRQEAQSSSGWNQQYGGFVRSQTIIGNPQNDRNRNANNTSEPRKYKRGNFFFGN